MAGAFDPLAFDSGAFDAPIASFTIDSIVRVNRSGTFTVNEIVRVSQSGTLTIDEVVRASRSATFTVDELVRTIGAGSFTIDLWVPGGTSGEFTIDSMVRVVRTGSFTVDELIRSTRSGVLTVDEWVRASRSGSFTLNEYVTNTHSSSFLVNMWVSAVNTTVLDDRNRHDRIDTHFGMGLASDVALSDTYPGFPSATNLFELLSQMWDSVSAKETGVSRIFKLFTIDMLISFTGPWTWEDADQIAGWILDDNSTNQNTPPNEPWFIRLGTTFGSNFLAHGGTHYLLSAPFGNGAKSIWALTPVLPLTNGSVISFWSRRRGSLGGARLQVRLSEAGSSVDVGTAVEDVGDFTTLIYDSLVSSTYPSYPTSWAQISRFLNTLPSGTTYGRIAFRQYLPAADVPSLPTLYSESIGLDDIEFLALTIRTGSFAIDTYVAIGGQLTIDQIVRAQLSDSFSIDLYVDDFAILDDFNRTTSPDSLGSASSGPTWVGNPYTDIDSFVNGSEWQFNQNGNSLGYSNFASYIMDHGSDFGDATDYTVIVRLKVDALFTTGITLANQYGNFEFGGGFGDYPEVGLYYYPDQDSDLHLFVTSSNSGNPYDEVVVDVVPGDGEWYILEWEHHPSSNTSRAKIYRENESDPGWLVTRDPTGDHVTVLPSYFSARIDGWSNARVDWIKVRHE